MGLLTKLLVMIVRPRVAVIEFSAVVLMITTVIVIVVVLLAALLLTALLVVAATVVIAVTIRLHAVRGGRLSRSRGLLSSVARGGPLTSLIRVWGGGAVFVVVRIFVALRVELQTVVIVVAIAVAVATIVVVIVVVVVVQLVVLIVVVLQWVVLLPAVVPEVGVIVVVVDKVLVGRVRVPSTVLPLLHCRPEVKVVVVAVVVGGRGTEQRRRVVSLVRPLVLELRVVRRTGQAVSVALLLPLPVDW